PPSSPTLSGSCVRASSPAGGDATPPSPAPPLRSPRTRPAASLLLALHAPSPLLRAPTRAPPAPPRSLPTRSGSLAPSLDGQLAQETRSGRLPSISPGLRSDTSAPPLLLNTGR